MGRELMRCVIGLALLPFVGVVDLLTGASGGGDRRVGSVPWGLGEVRTAMNGRKVREMQKEGYERHYPGIVKLITSFRFKSVDGADPDQISGELGPFRHKWNRGDVHRVSGVERRYSYCTRGLPTFNIYNDDTGPWRDCLLDFLGLHTGSLKSLRARGWQAELYLTVVEHEINGFLVDHELMALLGQLSVDLGIEITEPSEAELESWKLQNFEGE